MNQPEAGIEPFDQIDACLLSHDFRIDRGRAGEATIHVVSLIARILNPREKLIGRRKKQDVAVEQEHSLTAEIVRKVEDLGREMILNPKPPASRIIRELRNNLGIRSR